MSVNEINENLVMISLVGDQPMPNLIPNLEFMPERSYFLTTDRTQSVFDHMKTVLAKKGISCKSVQVGAFDFPDVERKCKEILNQTSVQTEVIFNVTSGTKIMTLGSFSVALGSNSRIIYTIDSTEYLPDVSENTRNYYNTRISLDDCLEAHGISITDEGEAQDMLDRSAGMDEFVIGFGHRAEDLASILEIIRKRYNDNNFNLINRQIQSKNEKWFLDQLSSFKLIKNYDPKTGQFRIIDDPKIRKFLTGGWLELFAFLKVEQIKPKEWQVDVKIEDSEGARNEIDVLFVKDNKLIAISCKTGAIPNEHLQALGSLTRKVGGQMSKAFLVTSKKIDKNDGTYYRAESEKIEIVNPQQFCNLQSILEKQFR